MKKISTLSVVTIAKNESDYIDNFLESISWADEIIIINNASSDATFQKASQYTSKVYTSSESNLGKLKQYALKFATGDWILVLDVDEILSPELISEIKQHLNIKPVYQAYKIRYQNHFLGHPLICRAQQYAKVRLFQRGKAEVSQEAVHEEILVHTSKIGQLHGVIFHYSFRSLPQVIRKFTYYARLEVPLLQKQRIRPTLRHITIYPLHMFWSIFIEDEGHKDHVWGFLLGVCFMYYEWARYFFLWKLRK